jgi:stage II sporulation protein P
MSAREEVAQLCSQREETAAKGEKKEEDAVIVPVEETPLVPQTPTDNGVEGRTLVPSSTEGYVVSGLAYISNATDYPVTAGEVGQPFAASLGEGTPQILIIHTHGSESYTPAEEQGIVWSGDHRTTDARYNVVRVGDAIADTLAEAGISVLHDRTLYDYPSYSGAYDRSLAAIESYLAQYPSISFILDVHRDAVEDGQGNQYKVVSETGKGTAAQLTLVVGSDGSGLAHPEWMENLRLAAALQESLLEEHPTLMRPLLLRNSRYNQHTTTGSLLLEAGAAGNSPEEALLAGQLFAEHFIKVLRTAEQ